MLDKKFVESFLRVNNVTDTTSDDDVREILHAAGWRSDDVESTVSMRHGGSYAGDVIATPAVFRPDMELSSKQLSALLGVDLHLEPGSVREALHDAPTMRAYIIRTVGLVAIILLSLGLAMAAAAFAAYALDIRPI